MKSHYLAALIFAGAAFGATASNALAGDHKHNVNNFSRGAISTPARGFYAPSTGRNSFVRPTPTFNAAPAFNVTRASHAPAFAARPAAHFNPAPAVAPRFTPSVPAVATSTYPVRRQWLNNTTIGDNDGDENNSNWNRYNHEPDADDYQNQTGQYGYGYTAPTYYNPAPPQVVCTGDGDEDDCNQVGGYYGAQNGGYPLVGGSLASERAQLLQQKAIAKANYASALASGNRRAIKQTHAALMAIDHQIARVNARMFGTYTPGPGLQSTVGQYFGQNGYPGYNGYGGAYNGYNGYGYNQGYGTNGLAALAPLIQNFLP